MSSTQVISGKIKEEKKREKETRQKLILFGNGCHPFSIHPLINQLPPMSPGFLYS
jgi:hypothetical protein